MVFLGDANPGFPHNERGEHNRTFVWNEDMKGTGVSLGRWPVQELWAAYADDAENHLVMPHVGGRRYILTLDNHYLEYGQGVMVAAALARTGVRADVVPIGLTEIPACGGNADVLAYHGLDGPSIARTVLGRVRSRIPVQ